tara:strand:- start:1457 stop:2161 length:705 start_codon:yes stop_codon:yes gene_type:complete
MKKLKKVSIVVPCYNEIQYIEEVINNIISNNIESKEIIVVDDYSTDGTIEVLQKLSQSLNIKVLFNEKNFGKGYCLRKGFKIATGEIIIIHDADLEYDVSDHSKLLKPILDNQADVVYGSRFIGSEAKRVVYFWNRLANFILTNICNIFLNLSMTDVYTCLKAFKKNDIEGVKLIENRFGIEPEITFKLARKKLVFYEVGIHYHGRTYAEGKKIKLLDAFYALFIILKLSFFSK